MAELAGEIQPDEIQINTPLRPKRGGALSAKEISEIEKEFRGFRNVITVYKSSRPKTTPVETEGIARIKRTRI